MQAKKDDESANRELRRRAAFDFPLREIAGLPGALARGSTAFARVLSGRCFDLDRADHDVFEAACRDPKGLADACGLMDGLREDPRRRNARSGLPRTVYLIQVADQPITKIGISHNPLKRCQSLQEAHYAPLVLWAVIFCPTHRSETIEQTVLQIAETQGRRLMGEWMAGDPRYWFLMALETARQLRIPVCNAAVWLENLSLRTRYLAKNLGLTAILRNP